MSDAALKTGRKRGRPPKNGAGPGPIKRTPRRCLGFGEDHYFMSAGKGNRRCPACEDRLRKLGLGMRFDRAVKDPEL